MGIFTEFGKLLTDPFTPAPSNENPYPVETNVAETQFGLPYQGATGSTSAPASALGGTAGGSHSIPRLNAIPEPQAMEAFMKLRGM